MKRFYLSTIMLFVCTQSVRAEIYELDFDEAPADQFLDRWMYPFNISPGVRIQAPTFGAVNSDGFR